MLITSVSQNESKGNKQPASKTTSHSAVHLVNSLNKIMAVTFTDLGSAAGLKKLDEYLLSRSYISGYQASKDDITVYAALSGAPSSSYVNVSRWYNHIDALLRISGVSGEGSGVTVEGFVPAEAVATPPAADSKAAAAEDDDDDDDVDLFGEETEEEKKAAEERAAAIKASGKKKESGKSSVLLDIKPWDDETDMKKLEEAVRAVQMEGLLWGASKLVPVGYGIKKLQIIAVTLLHSTRYNGYFLLFAGVSLGSYALLCSKIFIQSFCFC
ncbi:hypothetical protein V6N13_096500 [Hibiscus sabdariffa]|uniref:Translation elongation factor EF1B beta/delta subunit guanine nucleotide exchange domain-containing protein n=1 Tax=Hibiscus sabdariffa TaxID=183260 RepID=A0ABR2DFI0_9ROSI